jgi:hypothetical protein
LGFAEFMHGSVKKEMKRDKEVVKEFMKEFDWEVKGEVVKKNVEMVLAGEENKKALESFCMYFSTNKVEKMNEEEFYNFIVKSINS